MSAWGRWGEDDQRGAANLIDADATRRGIATVRTGEVLGLAMPMHAGDASPAVGRPPLQHFMARDGGDYAAGRPERGGFGFADDSVLLATHGGTHVDALSHVWKDGLMYNGFSAGTVGSRGAAVCGIERVGPLVTRAITVDLVEGPRGGLEPGESVDAKRLADAIAGGGVAPEPGDALLVRTGWAQAWVRGTADGAAWPGLDADCADWIAEHDIAIVGADNVAVEAFPSSDEQCQMPLHIALLRDRGVYFVEMLALDELASRRRPSVMFVLSPLPLVGAVGSPVNPVAIL
jgi:kynurenine formamidase